MQNFKLYLLLVFFILINNNVWSQAVNDKIDDSFNKATLVEFFNRLEKKVPYKFYYNKAQLDSFTLQLDVKGLTLSGVLKEAFKGTDILYGIDDINKNVYITRKLQLVTELPKGIFMHIDNSTAKSNVLNDSIADFDIASGKVAKATTRKLIEIGRKANQKGGNIILTGYIRNATTGEPLVNATVFIDSVHITTTDLYGHYSLTIPTGDRILNVQNIGMKDGKFQLAVSI